MLYEFEETRPNGAAKHRLAEPVLLDPQAVYEVAKEYFDQWMQKARVHLEAARLLENNKSHKLSVFHLHQTTEALYSCFFLTRMLYVPKDHNIKHLRSHA